MLTAGYYQTLTVGRISDHGLYLNDSDKIVEPKDEQHVEPTDTDNEVENGTEMNEVLLPNRYVSLQDKVGDKIEVFVYHDSDNRLIATRERPLVTSDHAAWLQVKDKSIHGAFVDWGITAKDLFVPNSNQPCRMEIGRHYIVYAYTDTITGRIVATARLNSFIKNDTIELRPRQKVEILVAQRLDKGFRVIINDRNWGMIYDNQLFRQVSIGQRTTAFVRRITPDNRIDISLQQQGMNEVADASERLHKIVEDNGGVLALGDSSSPEQIYAATQMSKKTFKKALGVLMSHGMATTEQNSIKLTEKNK